MQRTKFRNVEDVADRGLCVGCGACVYACADRRVRLVDLVDQGLRPVVAPGDCASCSDCVAACPGIGISHAAAHEDSGMRGVRDGWGPVLEVWEGFASDAALRFHGSSGGLASALSVYCIEKRAMHGVLHVGNDEAGGYRNRTVLSRNGGEMLESTGSRYSPGSPCDLLQAVEDAPAPCVFVGKPCDVEGVRLAEAIRPRLQANLGVVIAIFCAGTPSTAGTVDLLRAHGVDPSAVHEIRYRGRGWPGSFAVRLKGETQWRELATYEQAWGFLQRYRPFRCHLCPDGTGEFADISCGDPWYMPSEEDEPGQSLVVVRTEKGREIVGGALRDGYAQLRPVRRQVLDLSQRELQLKRGAIWGRVTTMAALGIPAPRFRRFRLFRSWLRIPAMHKVRSVVGTARRVIVRRLYVRQQLRRSQ